jgi:hypothetical protein
MFLLLLVIFSRGINIIFLHILGVLTMLAQDIHNNCDDAVLEPNMSTYSGLPLRNCLMFFGQFILLNLHMKAQLFI